MQIKNLIKAAQKPKVYAQGTAMMWVDEYISTQLLETHLSQDIELASRKESTITSTIEWILGKVPGYGMSILDLGCGPGLYTEKLAEKGHTVTGMDFSLNSIRYAQESASKKGLDISYIQQDYLKLNEVCRYDLIMMIYTDFCVLTPDQRKILLGNIHRALKPGGVFLFDVLNENSSIKKDVAKRLELSDKGFWRDKPYLAVSESFYYPEQNVTLNQHIILADDEDMAVYRFWMHTFSHSDLGKIMTSGGFRSAECYDRVIPDSDLCSSESVSFCIAVK